MGLEEELRGFTGTTRYHRHYLGVLFTDGVRFLAERAGAYWLLDVIASYQPQLGGVEFQVWKLEKGSNSSALVYAVEDEGEPPLVEQEIPYTDFPLDEFKLYCQNNVILLPSEY